MTLAYFDSATSTAETITFPASIQAGDIIVLHDVASAIDFRVTCSYKIADGTESGALTGMNGDDTNNKIMMVFRGATAAVIPGSASSSKSYNDPDPISVVAESGPEPLIVFGLYRSTTVPTRTFSPAEDAEFSSSTVHYAKYKIYNTSPQTTTIDVDDTGDVNIIAGYYLGGEGAVQKLIGNCLTESCFLAGRALVGGAR